MQAQNSFKKGDHIFFVLNYGAFGEESMIVDGIIEKITTEDRIKFHFDKKISRSRRNVPNPEIVKDMVPEGEDKDEWFEKHFPYQDNFPKMGWVSYIHPETGEKKASWRNLDSLKKNPSEFIQPLN